MFTNLRKEHGENAGERRGSKALFGWTRLNLSLTWPQRVKRIGHKRHKIGITRMNAHDVRMNVKRSVNAEPPNVIEGYPSAAPPVPLTDRHNGSSNLPNCVDLSGYSISFIGVLYFLLLLHCCSHCI